MGTTQSTLKINNLVALEHCRAIATWRPFRDEVATLIRSNANALVIVGAKVHDIRIKRSVRRRQREAQVPELCRLRRYKTAFQTLKGLKAWRFRQTLADVTGLKDDVIDLILSYM